MTMGPISLRVQHLAIGVHTCRRTRVILLYKKHRLQVEKQRRILPCTNSSSECSEHRHQSSEADLHHFALNVHIDGGKGVTDILHLGGVVSHRHVTLTHIAQLLSELEFPCCGACDENLFQISPSILRHSCILNVAQELFAHIGCETVESSARQLFPGWEVSLC